MYHRYAAPPKFLQISPQMLCPLWRTVHSPYTPLWPFIALIIPNQVSLSSHNQSTLIVCFITTSSNYHDKTKRKTNKLKSFHIQAMLIAGLRTASTVLLLSSCRVFRCLEGIWSLAFPLADIVISVHRQSKQLGRPSTPNIIIAV